MESLKVTEAESGQKLFQFLQRRVHAENNELHRWIRTGQIRINGKRATAFEHIIKGDEIRIPPFAVLRVHKEDSPHLYRSKKSSDKTLCSVFLHLPIVYEDKEILLINKPAGLPVQNGTGHTDSVVSRLKTAFSLADFLPAPVHRLDMDTSGLLLIGKTYNAIQYFSDAFSKHKKNIVEKKYMVWVQGEWSFPNDYIMEDFLEQKKIIYTVSNNLGKKAFSSVTILKKRLIQKKKYSLLSITLFTGRKHQIRVQCASRGFPVVGDVKYGEKTQSNLRIGLKLHAFSLTITMPDGNTRSWQCDPDWNTPWNIY